MLSFSLNSDVSIDSSTMKTFSILVDIFMSMQHERPYMLDHFDKIIDKFLFRKNAKAPARWIEGYLNGSFKGCDSAIKGIKPDVYFETKRTLSDVSLDDLHGELLVSSEIISLFKLGDDDLDELLSIDSFYSNITLLKEHILIVLGFDFIDLFEGIRSERIEFSRKTSNVIKRLVKDESINDFCFVNFDCSLTDMFTMYFKYSTYFNYI